MSSGTATFTRMAIPSLFTDTTRPHASTCPETICPPNLPPHGIARSRFTFEPRARLPSDVLLMVSGMAQAVKRNVTFLPMNPRACGGAGGGASGAHRGVFCSKWGLSAGKKAASQGRGRVVPSPSSGRRAHAGGLAFSASSAVPVGACQAQGRWCSSARGSGRAQGPRGRRASPPPTERRSQLQPEGMRSLLPRFQLNFLSVGTADTRQRRLFAPRAGVGIPSYSASRGPRPHAASIRQLAITPPTSDMHEK